jgi:hypothetical protein
MQHGPSNGDATHCRTTDEACEGEERSENRKPASPCERQRYENDIARDVGNEHAVQSQDTYCIDDSRYCRKENEQPWQWTMPLISDES